MGEIQRAVHALQTTTVCPTKQGRATVRLDRIREMRRKARAECHQRLFECLERGHISDLRLTRVDLRCHHPSHRREHPHWIERGFGGQQPVVNLAVPLHLHPRVECGDTGTDEN